VGFLESSGLLAPYPSGLPAGPSISSFKSIELLEKMILMIGLHPFTI